MWKQYKIKKMLKNQIVILTFENVPPIDNTAQLALATYKYVFPNH